jgi:hypothetical protein
MPSAFFVVARRFDEPNLVSSAGVMPLLALTARVGLRGLIE